MHAAAICCKLYKPFLFKIFDQSAIDFSIIKIEMEYCNHSIDLLLKENHVDDTSKVDHMYI